MVHSISTSNTWLNTLNVGACMKFTRVLTKLQFEFGSLWMKLFKIVSEVFEFCKMQSLHVGELCC